MKGVEVKRSDEPVGIVISGPAQPVQTTVFRAYVWSAAPPPSAEEDPKTA